MSKPNKDGWIRHRGGKCPVYDGVLVEVRNRAGDIALKDGDSCTSVSWHWSHDKHPGDIMAYRIYKPVEQPVIDLPHGYGEVITATLEAKDGPLQWRDRITEIYRTVEALEEERVSLVQRLESEGFRLIERVVQPVEDMSDCMNWKKGDKVMANDDSAGFGVGFHEGGIYVMREDCTNKGHSIKVVEDDNGVENG